MTSFQIEGQKPLSGEIIVNGSKNSCLKVMAACLLTTDRVKLRNIPRIEDVYRLLEMLETLGVVVTWVGEHDLAIQASRVNPEALNFEAVGRLRASVILMGALIGRCGRVRIPGPGGDQIGARPLDAHLTAFRALGVQIESQGDVYHLKSLKRGDIGFTLSEFSVTATENAVLASVLSAGNTTVIRCAAAEPSVQDLCWFLQALGADISGIGTHTLVIKGVKRLSGELTYTIMPDPVEAGTFICLAAAARAEILIKNVPTFLDAEIEKFRQAGVSFELINRRPGPDEHYQLVDFAVHRTSPLQPLKKLHNMPYPGIFADLLPPFTVLLTQANGTSLVHDWMYEGRLKYVEELNKMEAGIFIADPHRILVTGPRNLYGSQITNYDIRTGASLFIAALIAAGTSIVGPVYQLDRGYERLDGRLSALGASIRRIETT